MSQRNTKMMMLLAQKNKELREKFKKSKRLKLDIRSVDPEYFPSSDDSDTDCPLSRLDSAKLNIDEGTNLHETLNCLETEEQNIFLRPSTSNEEHVDQNQNHQNLENLDNIPISSLITLTTVPLLTNKYNDDLTIISSPTLQANHENNTDYNLNYDINVIKLLNKESGDDHGKSVVPQNNNDKTLEISSNEKNHTSANEETKNTTDDSTYMIDNEDCIISTTVPNPVVASTNSNSDETDTGPNQHEIVENDITQEFVPYTKSGTIRKRKKFDLSLKERLEAKKSIKREEHCVKPPCIESCKKMCIQKICEEQRKTINESFWTLNNKERAAFMLHHTSKQPVKQRTVNEPIESDYRRQNTFTYFLKDENGTSCVVCKTFFLTTLGFKASNDKPLQTAIIARTRDSVLAPEDKRCTKAPHNKIDDAPIKNHVLGFEPTISHYRREHAPKRLYLPSDLSISSMYKDFVHKNPTVKISYDKYRKVVQDLNISFVKLGHEECEECEAFNLHDSGHNKENLCENCIGCSNWTSHIKRANKSREQYKLDTDLKDNDTVIYSADLQKVIMLPRIDMFKTAIFTHRIVVYNESFVPIGKSGKDGNAIFPVLWHEAVCGRSKDEIISAYYHFLLFHRDIGNIILWVDNCSSQNKNWAFFSFLIYIVNSDEINANKIIIKYFEPGHTFMSADSFHHRVELSMKRMKNKIYDFEDFCQAVGTAGKNVKIKRMTPNEFYEWQDYTTQYKLSRLTPRPYISEIVYVEVNRGSFDLTYKTAFDGELISASIISNKILKSKSLPPPEQKTTAKGISQTKKDALLDSLQTLIPANRISFWRELPTF